MRLIVKHDPESSPIEVGNSMYIQSGIMAVVTQIITKTTEETVCEYDLVADFRTSAAVGEEEEIIINDSADSALVGNFELDSSIKDNEKEIK